MSTTVDGGRRRNAAATAKKLLDAAQARFARNGFESTSLREIAAVQSRDHSALAIIAGITRCGQDHSERRLWVPFGMDRVELSFKTGF